jgi:hypothetical protein
VTPETHLPSDGRRNAALTFQGNTGLARHGWLRLTPAYGVRLVEAELAANPDAGRVLDPFSGTGTTGVCAAATGRHCELIDLNPFLIWLARTKTRSYSSIQLAAARSMATMIGEHARSVWQQTDLWEPPIHNITRWWSPSGRAALRALRAGCDLVEASGAEIDLPLIAFCQVVIDASSAAFNHVSMSFKDVVHDHELPQAAGVRPLLADFEARATQILDQAECNLAGVAAVHLGDARDIRPVLTTPVDLLLTSPPYCNRVSYIRELRPYMYWLRYLQHGSDAGELDWRAIGGTWGTATSRLMTYEPAALPPAGTGLPQVLAQIAAAPQANAQLLSRYVGRYVTDVWTHVRSAHDVLRPGGRASYIVGNSTFFGVQVPTHEYYAALMRETGFVSVDIQRLRKRNSNKALYEYAVRGRRS